MSFTSIVLRFVRGGSASGDDADNVPVISFAMAYQEKPRVRTHAQQEKAVFVERVFFIKELHREVIVEDGLGYLECDLVFLGI